MGTRALVRFAQALVILVLLPAAAFAQASISGTVKDSSGAVLPGVTVEASSPVLIEKARSAVTDGSGQYRIVDLPAGAYTVTFTLAGFTTVKREGVELTGSFNAAISAEMKVGAVSETVTVSGETPIVDVQSISRQTVVQGDVMKDLPAARSYAGVMMLIPATTPAGGSNLDIQVSPGMLVFGGAGGRNNEARIQVDGLNTGAAFNGAGVSSYIPDIADAQEVAMTTSGGMGESEVGGPSFSVVPKSGGNTFKGSAYLSDVTKGMVGDNYTTELQQRGLKTPGALYKLWDYNVGFGGPIKRDTIWFFVQTRNEGSYRTVPGMFANANMGDPNAWTYVADTSRPAVAAGSWMTGSARITYQPNTRNKFNVFWDQQIPCQGAGYPGSNEGCRQSGSGQIICGAPGASNPACSATAAPEVGTYLGGYGQRVQQATWTSPVTNKLLLEAAMGTYLSQWGGTPWPGSNFSQLVGMTEQCAPSCPANGNIPNLAYRSGNYRQNFEGPISFRASASYVTGAHNMKVGYQGGHLIDDEWNYNNDQFVSYQVNNGVPNRITESINQFNQNQRVRYMAFFGQDQWTLGRFTLQGALRYDRAWSWYPAVTVQAQRFLAQPIPFPETPGVDAYNDVSPRGGFAWDVFGHGKTSVKVNVGKYLQAAQNGLTYAALRPTGRLTTSVTRSWTDTNKNYIPDCDLTNPKANSGADVCGQISDLAFGTQKFTSTLAPELISGWGVRPGDWQIGASVQQQIVQRVSLEIGYNRRWLTNFTVTDNTLQSPTDFGTFSLVAPTDPRLGAASGETLTGLYNVNQNVASSVNSVQTLSSDFGKYSQMYNGILMNVSARPRNGFVFQGGFNTGTTRTDLCEVKAQVPESDPTNPWCNTSTGWITRYTGLASYTLPRVDVLVSGTFRSDQGAPLAANWVVSNAIVQPSLGRPLSNSAPNVTVNLVEPGTMYGDRVNEFDMRFGKILKIGHTRTDVGFDVYNILNSAAVLSYNNAYSPTTTTWLTPTAVLQPRFWKFSAQIDF